MQLKNYFQHDFISQTQLATPE